MKFLPRRAESQCPLLVVEENVGAEGLQEFAFVHAAQKKTLIDADVPSAPGFEHALMRRGAARRIRFVLFPL